MLRVYYAKDRDNNWDCFAFFLTETSRGLLSMAIRLRQRSADRIIKEDAPIQRNEYHARFYDRCGTGLVDRSCSLMNVQVHNADRNLFTEIFLIVITVINRTFSFR